MGGVHTFMTICLFGFVFHSGNASFECPVPPNSSLIYLDLERLNLLALQQGYHNTIHSPLLCAKGSDEECLNQQCCPGEEGCCLSHRKKEDKHIRKCGCMKPDEKHCKYPAPYAILANSECTMNESRTIYGCLREKRDTDVLHKQVDLKGDYKSSGQENERYSPLDLPGRALTLFLENILTERNLLRNHQV